MPNWGQLETSSLLMTAGVALLAAVFMRLTLRRLGRARQADRPSRTGVNRELVSPERATHTSALDAREVQLHEMARELSAQLDSKVILLEEWIRLARIEAERLERAVAAARAEGLLDEASDAERVSIERGR